MLEDQSHRDVPNIQLFYRPVRQMVYAILFNLHHHTFLAEKQREQQNEKREPSNETRSHFVIKNLVNRTDISATQMEYQMDLRLLTILQQTLLLAVMCLHNHSQVLVPLIKRIPSFPRLKFENGYGQQPIHTDTRKLLQQPRLAGPCRLCTASGSERQWV